MGSLSRYVGCVELRTIRNISCLKRVRKCIFHLISRLDGTNQLSVLSSAALYFTTPFI